MKKKKNVKEKPTRETLELTPSTRSSSSPYPSNTSDPQTEKEEDENEKNKNVPTRGPLLRSTPSGTRSSNANERPPKNTNSCCIIV